MNCSIKDLFKLSDLFAFHDLLCMIGDRLHSGGVSKLRESSL